VSTKSPHRKLQKTKTILVLVAMKKNLLPNLGNPKPCSRRPQNARHTQEEPWKYQATIQGDRVVVEEDKVQDDGSKRTALLRVRDEPSATEKARCSHNSTYEESKSAAVAANPRDLSVPVTAENTR
jgi:hypothetical protein